MDLIDSNAAVSTIAQGSTGYLAEFSPIFVFAIGLALAFVIMTALIQGFIGRKRDSDLD